MSVSLIKWELKKLWRLPMVPIFLALCLGLILLIVGVTWYDQQEAVDAVSYIVDVTDTIGGRMGQSFDTALSALPENCWKNTLITQTAGVDDIFEDFNALSLRNGIIAWYGVTGKLADIPDAEIYPLLGCGGYVGRGRRFAGYGRSGNHEEIIRPLVGNPLPCPYNGKHNSVRDHGSVCLRQ